MIGCAHLSLIFVILHCKNCEMKHSCLLRKRLTALRFRELVAIFRLKRVPGIYVPSRLGDIADCFEYARCLLPRAARNSFYSVVVRLTSVQSIFKISLGESTRRYRPRCIRLLFAALAL